MSNNFIESRELVRCAASRKDGVFILSKGKSLIELGVSHTSVIANQEGTWKDCFDTNWDASAIVVARRPSAKLLIVGEQGDVALYRGTPQFLRETISPTPTAIRRARAIDGLAYACGMRRQVYVRRDEATWVDISAPAPSSLEGVGFEDIGGYSESNIYAAGWRGEIWHFDGSIWTQHQIPSNAVITSICCAPDGTIYAGGQRGTLALSRDDAWRMLEPSHSFDLDVWDMTWYRSELYIATNTSLFKLVNGDPQRIDILAGRQLTCGSLSVAEDVLWSVGPSDVASFDGNHWRVYTQI